MAAAAEIVFKTVGALITELPTTSSLTVILQASDARCLTTSIALGTLVNTDALAATGTLVSVLMLVVGVVVVVVVDSASFCNVVVVVVAKRTLHILLGVTTTGAGAGCTARRVCVCVCAFEICLKRRVFKRT